MASKLRMISDQLGISQSSVSQILNRKACDFSSEHTRARVFALARQLGYKQRFADKVLRDEPTRTVAVLVSMHRVLIESHIQALILFLLDHFTKEGYEFYLRIIAGDEETNLQVVSDLLSRGVDRFVCIGCPTGLTKIEDLVRERGRHLIGYGEAFRRRVTSLVSGFIEATIRMFLQNGRKNFCYFLSNSRQINRIEAVRNLFPELTTDEVLRKHIRFLDFEEELPVLGDALLCGTDQLAQRGYERTKVLMEEHPETDAILYLSDYYMLGGVQYLAEHGVRIGKEILLCGSNNIDAVRNHIVPLASWQLDLEQMARILYERSGDDESFADTLPRKFSPNRVALREEIFKDCVLSQA